MGSYAESGCCGPSSPCARGHRCPGSGVGSGFHTRSLQGRVHCGRCGMWNVAAFSGQASRSHRMRTGARLSRLLRLDRRIARRFFITRSDVCFRNLLRAGEGELTGVPSVFVRSSGYNLRRWCTHLPSWSLGRMRAIASVWKDVALSAQHVVLTGGEPMAARDIHALAAAMREAGKHITIETAATVERRDRLRSGVISQAGECCCGRQDRSGPLVQLRLRPEIIRQWIEEYPFQQKFVVTRGGACGDRRVVGICRRRDSRLPRFVDA
jgi:hypothetical protein